MFCALFYLSQFHLSCTFGVAIPSASLSTILMFRSEWSGYKCSVNIWCVGLSTLEHQILRVVASATDFFEAPGYRIRVIPLELSLVSSYAALGSQKNMHIIRIMGTQSCVSCSRKRHK